MNSIRVLINARRERLGEDTKVVSTRVSAEDTSAGPKRSPSVFEQTTDLRKEMEMTEHHETCEEVAVRYSSSVANGLPPEDAKKVC